MEHVVPLTQGFYISFRGIFTPESRLEIAYSAFSYKGELYLGILNRRFIFYICFFNQYNFQIENKPYAV